MSEGTAPARPDLIPPATSWETAWTPELVAARFNTDATESIRVLEVALAELRRAFADAFRPVPAATWDDCVLRVVGAVVGAKRRPSGGAGQLTKADVDGPPIPRDYLAGVRHIIAQYVVPGLA